MTEKDLEIQELRREVARLKADNDSLEAIHKLDQGEIVWLRRMVEAAVEGREMPNG